MSQEELKQQVRKAVETWDIILCKDDSEVAKINFGELQKEDFSLYVDIGTSRVKLFRIDPVFLNSIVITRLMERIFPWRCGKE